MQGLHTAAGKGLQQQARISPACSQSRALPALLPCTVAGNAVVPGLQLALASCLMCQCCRRCAADPDLQLPVVDVTYHPAEDEKFAPTPLLRSQAAFLLPGQSGNEVRRPCRRSAMHAQAAAHRLYVCLASHLVRRSDAYKPVGPRCCSGPASRCPGCGR